MPFWDISVDRANTLHTIAYGCLILGAVLTAVSTITLFWTSGIRERHSDQQIANAQLVAATANERAAQLAKEAEVARLEQERLREKLAWRRLSLRQRTVLMERLKGHSFEVWVSTVRDDPEARLFHEEIFDTLKEAGLKPQWFTGYQLAVGLSISSKGTDEEAILREAFSAAELPLGTKQGDGMAGDRPEITIGSKPPPF